MVDPATVIESFCGAMVSVMAPAWNKGTVLVSKPAAVTNKLAPAVSATET
jgi:hypothetical protein